MGGNLRVSLGTIVVVRFLPGRKKYKYLIVGEGEPSSPKNGVISISSPLAQVILDRETGEVVEFITPDNSPKLVEIVSVIGYQ